MEKICPRVVRPDIQQLKELFKAGPASPELLRHVPM